MVSVNCGPSCPSPPMPNKRMFNLSSGVASGSAPLELLSPFQVNGVI